MRLSQAMRRGSRKTYQVFGKYNDGSGGTCAMAAAMLGSGLISNSNMTIAAHTEFNDMFAQTLAQKATCPCCRMPMFAQDAIVHLNDAHQWTRERIAGWLESHVEVPTYSLLEMQEFMEDPELQPAVMVKVEA